MERKNTSWVRDGVANTLTPQLFDAFTRGLLAGFRISGFLPAKQAKAISARIENFVQDYRSAPGVGKIGESMFEHPHDFDEYAAYAAAWSADGIALREREELLNQVAGYLMLHTSYPIRMLSLGTIPCFAGIFRKINKGAGNHVDILDQDSDVFGDRSVKHQSSLVLHLTAPPEGGQTIVWERTPQPGDKEHLLEGWHYPDELFTESRKVEIPCVAGDLVLLSTINYHKVLPCIPAEANRLSFSLFLVVFEDEPGVIYIYN
jgi:hypothetical protein